MENNETFGMSCELAICEFYGLDHKISESRVSRQKTDWIKTILPSFPFQIVKHEGGSSKTDFFVQSNEDGEIQTLSVKSNKKNYLVCPQIMGQKSKKGFCEYFQVPSVDDPNLSIQSKIKQWIYNNPKIWLMEAFKNLSCCDYLLWISLKGYAHLYEKQKMLEQSYTIDFGQVAWKNSLEKWNESNVLKYNGKTIVEVQIHNKRDIIKFRIDLRFFGGHFPRKKPNSSDYINLTDTNKWKNVCLEDIPLTEFKHTTTSGKNLRINLTDTNKWKNVCLEDIPLTEFKHTTTSGKNLRINLTDTNKWKNVCLEDIPLTEFSSKNRLSTM